MCIDIVELWFGIANGQIFRQIFTELSAWETPIFSFPDDNLSKHQQVFIKLDMYIDILKVWFGIVNKQNSSNFDRVICPRHIHIFIFRTITWVKIKGF